MTTHDQDTSAADAAPILALVRAAGIAGFKSSEPPTRPSEAQSPSMNEQATDDPVIALIRAAGLPGFKGSKLQARNDSSADSDVDPVRQMIASAGLPGFSSTVDHGSHSRHDASSADPVLAMIAAAGLPGFQQHSQSEVAYQSASRHPVAPKITTGPSSAAPVPAQPRTSKQQYAVLHVATGGEAALAALEGAMGVPFAADNCGKPYWSAAAAPGGGTLRAFSLMQSQQRDLAGLVGELGSPALRLSVASIESARFAYAGPGARGRQDKGPPQLPDRLTGALRRSFARSS